MFEFLGNDRSIAIVAGTVLFGTFWRLWKLIFQRKKFKIFWYLCFPFIHKTAELFVEKFSQLRSD